MNHIEAEDERNLQSRLFNGDALQFVRAFRAAHVEGRAEQAFANKLEMFWPIVAVGFAVELLKLAEFFFERHPREQSVDLFSISAWGGVAGTAIAEARNTNMNRKIIDLTEFISIFPPDELS